MERHLPPSCALQILILLCFAALQLFAAGSFAQDDANSEQHADMAPIEQPSGPAPVDVRASNRELEGRLEILEERIDIMLELKNEQIDGVYRLLQWFSVIAGLLVFYLTVRDVINRRRDMQRQENVDQIVQDLMGSQHTALKQQNDVGEKYLKAADETLQRQHEGLNKVNEVISVVYQTLEFRLDQEKAVKETLESIEQMQARLNVFEQFDRRRFKKAIEIAEHFKDYSRMAFATLTSEAQRSGQRLRNLVDDLLYSYLPGQTDFMKTGLLYYVCGVLSYYDNDMGDASRYLDLAADTRASDHEGEVKANADYRARIAFTHFFRALLQKNWGNLHDAVHEIEECIRIRPPDKAEFLTPITRLELKSYEPGGERNCKNELDLLLQAIEKFKVDHGLDENQARLQTRAHLLLGNTYFQLNEFDDALECYKRAAPETLDNYYALSSIAQCLVRLDRLEEAQQQFALALQAIERTQDISRKRELVTRGVIVVLAAQCAIGSNDSTAAKYSEQARQLLDRKLSTNGMEPRFFSPQTKRLVSAQHLLGEIDFRPA